MDYLRRLNGVDPRLVAAVVHGARAFENENDMFVRVTEGMRTLHEQRVLKAEGKSHTLKSYHLTGKAVDLALISSKGACWDLPRYADLNECIQEAAHFLRCSITWGGDWQMADGVHWQLETQPFDGDF